MTVSHSCALRELCCLPRLASLQRLQHCQRRLQTGQMGGGRDMVGKQGRRHGVVKGTCKERRFIKIIFAPFVSETTASGRLSVDGGWRRGRTGQEHEWLFPPAQELSRPKGSALHTPPTSILPISSSICFLGLTTIVPSSIPYGDL